MTLLTVMSAGDRAVVGSEGYCDTSALFRELRRFGMSVEHVDFSSPDALRQAIDSTTRVVFAETISNPGMRLADLPALAAISHERGALLVVDNTFATPALCQPLSFGADIVVQSAGKFLAGHHDVTAGVIAGRADLIEPSSAIRVSVRPPAGRNRSVADVARAPNAGSSRPAFQPICARDRELADRPSPDQSGWVPGKCRACPQAVACRGRKCPHVSPSRRQLRRSNRNRAIGNHSLRPQRRWNYDDRLISTPDPLPGQNGSSNARAVFQRHNPPVGWDRTCG